jgi:hypothetical protein
MSESKFVIRSRQLSAPIPVDFQEADGTLVTILFTSPSLEAMDRMTPKPGRAIKVSQHMYSMLVEAAKPNQEWITAEWFKERLDMSALPVIEKLLGELVPNAAAEDDEDEEEAEE